MSPAGQRHEPRPEPVSGVARDLLHGALAGERREQPRGRGLGQAGSLGDLGDADRAVGERAEDGEGAPDGLDSGHGPLRRLDSRLAGSIIRHGSTSWNPRRGRRSRP